MGRGLGGSFNCIEKETQEKIAEDLNLALSSLRYRIKKMREFFPDASRQMMMETVENKREYLLF